MIKFNKYNLTATYRNELVIVRLIETKTDDVVFSTVITKDSEDYLPTYFYMWDIFEVLMNDILDKLRYAYPREINGYAKQLKIIRTLKDSPEYEILSDNAVRLEVN